ncbi:N-6 DNA methylase [Gimesia sp.]|uniref:Eco57I restriction-modification methylase domain-containing protein n=1 Tax=Gimesia sp. TaxID=2024833 RepID=UPI0032EB76F0
MIAPEPPDSCKVYTPRSLARAIVAAIADGVDQRWLEPSCGTGSFLEALAQLGVDRKRIVGVDLDRKASGADSLATVTRGVDFLEWSKTRKGRYDCVVGNPPYLPIRALLDPLRNTASNVVDVNGHPIGDRANTWYPFMVRAMEMLREGGNLAFILPAASEYADYASEGRKKLTRMFDRVDIVRSRRPLFNDVSEGVVVIIATGKGGESKLFRRHEVEDLQAAIQQIGRIQQTNARNCPKLRSPKKPEVVKFSDIANIRIGAVTGDSKFFVLNEEQRKQLRLPKKCLVPIVSRSRHIRLPAHDLQSWQHECDSGEKVWLFRPDPSCANMKSVRSYLDLSEGEGGCHKERFKIRNREPWYATPLPEHPDFFLTGMSGLGLWMCLNEHPQLNATNTLYMGTFREPLNRREKFAWALALLTSQVQKQIVRAKRVYADGLSKLEPGQVNALVLPEPPVISDAVSVYRRAASAFLSGDRRQAAAIADSAVLQ